MNTTIDKIIYPEHFASENIQAHNKQLEDLEKILESSGYKNDFIRKFRQRLKFLDEKKSNCIQKRDWFESLKNEPKLFSMKIKGKINIRILFTFCNINNKEIIILLCSFIEKTKKDYKPAINVAKTRLNEIK